MIAVASSALVTTGFLLGFAAPAWAHDYLVSSTPASGATITELPKQFQVTANENLLNLGGKGNGFFIEVKGPDGLYYGDGCVTVSGPSLQMNAALGPAGDYTMFWQAVSADGHIVSDDVPFTWKPGAGAPISTGSKTVPNCHGTLSAGPGNAQEAPKTPASSQTNGEMTALLWIGGGILAAGAAAAGTLLILSRSKKKPVE